VVPRWARLLPESIYLDGLRDVEKLAGSIASIPLHINCPGPKLALVDGISQQFKDYDENEILKFQNARFELRHHGQQYGNLIHSKKEAPDGKFRTIQLP
jgi:hypothetical protein